MGKLDLDASKREFIDKPDDEVNTSENSDSEDKPKKKKQRKKTTKKKKDAEATTKRLPPWKAFGDMVESPGFHCIHHIWQREGVQIGAEVSGPLLGSYYSTRLMFTKRWHGEKLRMTNFCQLQVLELPDGHYAVPRLQGVTLVTWRCRVQILPVAGDRWGDIVGDPTILVAHWSEEPSKVKNFEVPPSHFLKVDQELELRFADAAGTQEKVDKEFMEWQAVQLNKEKELDKA